MLSKIPITSLLLSFVASAYCSPIYASTSIFSVGCAQPIHQNLDTMQGLRPNLENHLPFGYIYHIDIPGADVNTDIAIKSLEQNVWIPSKTAAILSSISYNQANSKLILTSRISKLNANSLNMASFQSANIKFGTFAYDKAKKEWYNSFKNGNLGGIIGKVTKSNIVHQMDGQNSHYELVLELAPLQSTGRNQLLDYAIDSDSTAVQLKWDGLARNGCKRNGSVSNRRDHFNEIIESAVLL